MQVPLELGRQIVYGAIVYARELGFEPHPDFGRAAGYLGAWDGSPGAFEKFFREPTDLTAADPPQFPMSWP